MAANGIQFGAAKGGFTLLEVLMAMVLFFGSIPVFALAYLNTLDAMASVQVNQSLEQDLEVIRKQVLLMADPEELEKGGEILTGEHGIARWDVEYEPTAIADLFAVTLYMNVVVETEGDVEEKEIRQDFYLLRPAWSEPTEREELRARTAERLTERQLNVSR